MQQRDMRSLIIILYHLVVVATFSKYPFPQGAAAGAAAITKSQKEKEKKQTSNDDDENRWGDQENNQQPRYWPRYSGTRRVRLLDGIWNTSRLEDGSSPSDYHGVTASYSRFDSMDPAINISEISTTERAAVPSTIEVIADPEHGYLPGYTGFRGVSFFRTRFETTTTESNKRNPSSPGLVVAARIQFQACSFYCRVWLNGVEIGDHVAGGYVAWWLDVPENVLRSGRQRRKQQRSEQQQQRPPEKQRGKIPQTDSASKENTATLVHELFVLVDNRFNSTTAPVHTGGDFWHYGGIVRSVEWHDFRLNPNPNPSSLASSSAESLLLETLPPKEAEEGIVFGSETNHRLGGSYDEALLPAEKENVIHNSTTAASSRVVTEKRRASIRRRDEQQQHHRSSLWSNNALWPWRLYVTPQKDLRTVKLTLQIVVAGGCIASNNNTTTDIRILEELRSNNRIKIYFDGKRSTNALDGLTTGAAPSRSPENISTTGRRGCTDRLLELGRIPVPNPRTWSTTDPHLHTVSVDLDGAVVTERFGLRFWDTTTAATDSNSGKIRLNGKALKLLGWNHHHQWPYTAASPTEKQLDEDIRLLKELGGANFVRGAHYPQDPRWLDRLDENGIVAWCETLGPAVSVQNLQDGYFLSAQNQQINEMLDNAFNHASVAFWGFFNEGPSHKEEACAGYRASFDAIRSRDDTRFVTYASDRWPSSDRCYGAASALSHNGYPGWYSNGDPETYWDSFATELFSGKHPDALGKPLVISEPGASGIYEWKRNQTAAKWTLRYQTDVVTRDVAAAIGNADFSGIALWHFFDFKVDDRWENSTHCDYLPGVLPPTCGYIDVDVGKASGRPGGANHKGSLDFFRRPKPVFREVASQYENETAAVPNNNA